MQTELKPSGHSPQEIRLWITAVCRRLNTTPTELARRAELAPSTVNRFLSGAGKNENVSASTISKLSAAVQNIYSDYIQKIGWEALDTVEAEANWTGKANSSFDRVALRVPVVAFVGTDTWLTADTAPKDETYDITVPIPAIYTRLPVIGLEIRGGTSNTIFPNTSVAICVPFYALDREPVHEEYVIVTRKDQFNRAESIIRKYVEDKMFEEDKFFERWLVGLDGESRFQRPMNISVPYNDTLIVSMLIVAKYEVLRPRFQRPAEFDPRKRG